MEINDVVAGLINVDDVGHEALMMLMMMITTVEPVVAK